jgi:leader peptidase (prepilin peptidase)/N-methyltransferase
MQSIIIYIIISLLLGCLISNFLELSNIKNGEDFSIKEYILNFKLKRIDITYVIVFFILLEIIDRNVTILSITTTVPLCFALVLAFVMDFKFMIIPDTSSIVIIVSGILKLIQELSKENLIDSLIGLVIGGITLFVINYIFEKITKKVGFGYGDMKLLGAIGFFMGYKSILVIMILSIVLSTIFGIIYLIVNKIKNIKDTYLPFGPFIVISTLIVCIVPASTIIDEYLFLMDILVNKMI